LTRSAVSKQLKYDTTQDCALRTMIVEPLPVDPDRVTAILDADEPN
jgi:hypothetical protein